MSHVDGRIFWDPSLPDMARAERAAIYDSMNMGLAKLHSVDVATVGLSDYGKPGSYFARQLQRWGEQYRASETSVHGEMNNLIVWLGANVPADDGRIALVHGDWRIDNMVFAKDSAELLAVLDWELSTLGHPFADLAYQCMQWRLPNAGESRGLAGLDRAALGIPSEIDYVALYCKRTGIAEVPDWPFLLAFSFFRVAAIVQGVYKRSLDGNASNPERARKMGEAVPLMARLATEIIEKGP
jgi:aminoglycoside phosphotransferase (APT) family kinase protein